ncbi:helix-turn-helix transcriptional regulator [Frankia sp. Cppng1_Ct_nod]|uniref:helix-turn-helix transcriptional regulator n=1 Tax=Frankia sp. Cppng1_Ct_nod TaxID=2897162 RepID=UPI0010417FA7|nr:helix-turn-helix transcriptional regulator [Frankia sp. Cppng1_Ct_nod]
MTLTVRAVSSAGSTAPRRTPNTRLRTCREERGWSQERLATELRRFAVIHEGREAGVTGNMVCKWEKGDKKPSLRYQRLLRALFHRTAGELGFIDDAGGSVSATSGPERDLDMPQPSVERRSFLRMVAAAGGVAATPVTFDTEPWERLSAALRQQSVVTTSTVDDLSAHTAGLYGLEERVPARALMDRVTTHLGTLSVLLETSPRSTIRRGLTTTAGETAALAGWLAFDMGNNSNALAYYRVAVEAAREADDNALWACVLGYESYQPGISGRPDQACALLTEAQRRAGQGGSMMTRAWLAAREAEEQAARGDGNAALRALDRATDAFDRADPECERAWTQFFDRSRLDGIRITTFTRLRRPEAAYAAAESLRTVNLASTKKRSLLLGTIAEVHLHRREIEQACQLAADALAIVAQTDFSLGLARIRRIYDQLRPWQAVQSVRDLDEQLRVLI